MEKRKGTLSDASQYLKSEVAALQTRLQSERQAVELKQLSKENENLRTELCEEQNIAFAVQTSEAAARNEIKKLQERLAMHRKQAKSETRLAVEAERLYWIGRERKRDSENALVMRENIRELRLLRRQSTRSAEREALVLCAKMEEVRRVENQFAKAVVGWKKCRERWATAVAALKLQTEEAESRECLVTVFWRWWAKTRYKRRRVLTESFRTSETKVKAIDSMEASTREECMEVASSQDKEISKLGTEMLRLRGALVKAKTALKRQRMKFVFQRRSVEQRRLQAAVAMISAKKRAEVELVKANVAWITETGVKSQATVSALQEEQRRLSKAHNTSATSVFHKRKVYFLKGNQNEMEEAKRWMEVATEMVWLRRELVREVTAGKHSNQLAKTSLKHFKEDILCLKMAYALGLEELKALKQKAMLLVVHRTLHQSRTRYLSRTWSAWRVETLLKRQQHLVQQQRKGYRQAKQIWKARLEKVKEYASSFKMRFCQEMAARVTSRDEHNEALRALEDRFLEKAAILCDEEAFNKISNEFSSY